jgi:hypothetical protein
MYFRDKKKIKRPDFKFKFKMQSLYQKMKNLQFFSFDDDNNKWSGNDLNALAVEEDKTKNQE